jgi:glycosyltransferase involved in cell wall biosynthesis
MEPQVSVVLPTYNWATVLPYSIGSVLDQTLSEFELLVVGDCCTDESEEVVRSFDDPRIEWINLTDRSGHQATPNNEGLHRARSAIVAYISHDDVWLPRHLELLVRAIDDGAALAHARWLQVVPGQRPRVVPRRGWSFRRGSCFPPTTFAHRRDVGLAVGGWRVPAETGHVFPECDLTARIAEAYGRPALVPLVTSIKLPAARRPGVYRERPHHEQRAWREQIRADATPEQTFFDTYAPRPRYPTRLVWTLGHTAKQIWRCIKT